MFSVVQGIALHGLEGFRVGVEADMGQGLPGFDIVGLPASSIRESKERVRAAITNSGYTWPRKRIVINLTPSDWRKDGTGLDLPIAIAILVASEQVPPVSADIVLLGELALDGEIRAFRGIWTAVHSALALDVRQIITPVCADIPSTANHSAIVLQLPTLPLALGALRGDLQVTPMRRSEQISIDRKTSLDLIDVAGQMAVKRALEIAAAGRHHLLLIGVPGSGKSMMAERLPSLLPPLPDDKWTEVRQIYSVAGMAIPTGPVPFRAPHYSLSPAGLLGGGSTPTPGEISLAHYGVLFLDEFPEFSRTALEGLRQPLESKQVTVSRSSYHCTFPADFQLIAAMNPCPCGYQDASNGPECTCTQRQLQLYKAKLSGPILDRIEMTVRVDKVDLAAIMDVDHIGRIPSAAIRSRVEQARAFQVERSNSSRSAEPKPRTPMAILQSMNMPKIARATLFASAEKHAMSARAIFKVAQLARTIADLATQPIIQPEHVMEALQYRFYQ